MGLDARIEFEQIGPLELERGLPLGFEMPSWEESDRLPQRREVHTHARYYGPGYERGPWPSICAVLMLLFACPGVGRVWYGHDCADEIHEITSERVLEISRHFMQNGERPYREAGQS